MSSARPSETPEADATPVVTKAVVVEAPKTEAKAERKISELTKNTAASVIQKFYRTNRPLVRPLPPSALIEYGIHLVSNDPEVETKGGFGAFAVADGPIALIATGGVSAVQHACELGNKRHVPKVFLIDNSSLVKICWDGLRAYTKAHKTQSQFLRDLAGFVSGPRILVTFAWVISLASKSLGPKFQANLKESLPIMLAIYQRFFQKLFDTHGFEHVCSVIENTLLINQSFADRPTFERIKFILDTSNIKNVFVDCSNIIPSVKKTAERNAIFENIALLHPRFSKHTNVQWDSGSSFFGPTMSRFYFDQTPGPIKKDILDVSAALIMITMQTGWKYGPVKNVARLEMKGDKREALKQIGRELKALGLRVAVGFNPDTTLSKLEVYEADKVAECDYDSRKIAAASVERGASSSSSSSAPPVAPAPVPRSMRM